MSSPFAGCWKLYGRENVELLLEKIKLPCQFFAAMKSVRFCEEIHVNGDNVHVNICVPEYTVPAHAKEINFEFGVEHTQSLPFGHEGKGKVTKESDTKWVANISHEGGSCTITREIRNCEMWVTIEGTKGKTVRKFERCPTSCQGQKECASASPFQGNWRLYGSENFEKFMEGLGVPDQWRCIFANMEVNESIHVNGNNVHIKISLPDVKVPAKVCEHSFKFGEPHEFKLPFGIQGTAVGTKVSDKKWQAKITKAEGEATFTREIVGEEMWCTLECHEKKIVHKFARPQFPGGSCPTKSSC